MFWQIFVFFLILVLLIIGCLIGFFFDRIKLSYEKRNYKKMVYKVLHYYAEENDCLLLNDVDVFTRMDTETCTHVDHILFCEKHIYLIQDIFAYGGLYGNLVDNNLFLKNENGVVKSFPNPVKKNLQIVRKYYDLIDTDPALNIFSSFVVFNNSLIVPNGVAKETSTDSLLPLRDLEKVIRLAETEEDSLPLPTEKVDKIVESLKERSDRTKALLDKMYQEEKTGIQEKYGRN